MIYLGADHGGFAHKAAIAAWLSAAGKQFEDLGAATLEPTDDYPQFAFAVAKKVAGDTEGVGIVICRSGGGMTIAANRVKGVRAVECFNAEQIMHARQDNDANVLAIAADFMTADEAITLIGLWLNTPFSGEDRHKRRIAQLDAL